MSLLTLIQDVCNAIGIDPPTAVISATDKNITSLLAMANTSGEELMKRYEWQELTKQATFTTTGTIPQGYLSSIASDFDRFINDTMWNQGLRQKIIGPITMQEYQQDLSFAVVGPPFKFIQYGGQLYIGPTATAAGQTVVFNYISGNWCTSDALVGQTRWQADSDLTVIPQRIHKLDLIWRWKQAKGLAYGEDLETAEGAIEKQIGTNTGRRILFVGGSDTRYFAENIPNGDWPAA